MKTWISGRKLLEEHNDLTENLFWDYVESGRLVPHESPDRKYIEERWSIFPPEKWEERLWRVFPTAELQKKWLDLDVKRGKLKLILKFRKRPSSPEFISCGISPKEVDKEIADLVTKIKASMEELAPNRVWKNLDVGPAQEQALFNKLLESEYRRSEVKKHFELIPEAQGRKETAKRRIGYDTEEPTRKSNYRADQWERAIPIARQLWDKNKKITLEEIKNDPAFKACFKEMPSDDRIRHKLNEAGIKLASGKR